MLHRSSLILLAPHSGRPRSTYKTKGAPVKQLVKGLGRCLRLFARDTAVNRRINTPSSNRRTRRWPSLRLALGALWVIAIVLAGAMSHPGPSKAGDADGGS